MSEAKPPFTDVPMEFARLGLFPGGVPFGQSMPLVLS